jgi:hypothetical protein
VFPFACTRDPLPESLRGQVGGADGFGIIVGCGESEFGRECIDPDPTGIVERIDLDEPPILLHDPVPAGHVVVEALQEPRWGRHSQRPHLIESANRAIPIPAADRFVGGSFGSVQDTRFCPKDRQDVALEGG